MATGRIESGQISLRSAGNVPAQQITMQQTDYSGQARLAQGNNALAQLVDRMSQSSMQMAGEFFKEQAVLDVANSPLSEQQLELAKNGDMSFLQLGSRLNIYDMTMRKARSAELAGAFDTEAKAEVVKIQSDVEAGTLTSENAAKKLNTLTSGFAKSLAQVDGDAALRFTATMGVYSKTVMAEAYKIEAKRQKEKAGVLLNADYVNTMKLVEPAISQGFTIGADGKEIPVDKILEMHRKQFVEKAFNVGGLQKSDQMAAQFDKAVSEAKVNALTKYFTSEENLSNSQEQLRRLKRGDAGRMSAMLQNMIASDFDSVIKVEANIMQANANRITLRNDEAAQAKLKRETDSNNLLLEYFTPKTTATRKREIGVELTKMGALSVDQIERFLDPKAKEGDPYAFANIETRIAFGEITDPEELKRVAARSGMNGSQYARLNSKLLEGFDKEKSEAYRYLRRVSGVPDVASTFASKDDQHKITKDERLKNIFDTKIKEFRQLNPGVPIPYSTLSRDSEKVYNETDKADANKNRARTQLGNYVKELVIKKTVPEGFSIDENTNVDDLIRRGIIPKNDKNDTAGFVQKQINILREAQR